MSHRSIMGYLVKLGQALVSWKMKKQATVSRSSVEAEYRATTDATSEVAWLRNLLYFLGVSATIAIMHCDNHAALHIAANLVFHELTKHIEVDSHFIRERLLSGVIAT